MKTLKFIIAAILELALITSAATAAGTTTISTGGTAYAGPLPNFLPLKSKGLEKGVALANGHYGTAWIYTEGFLQSADEVRVINVYGTDAADVAKKLAAQSFKVKTYDKTKPVYIYSSINDDSGGYLFFSQGYVQVNVVETPTGLVIQNTSNVSMKMAWGNVLTIPNVQSARILHKGANGETLWTEQVQIWGINKIIVPYQYGRTDGVLIVTTHYDTGGPNPGETIDTAYDLATGEKMPTTSITGSASYSIENHLSGSDAGYASTAQLVVSGRMTPPVDPNVDPYQLIAPPTATLNVNTAVGTKRTCKVIFTVQSTVLQLGTISAKAFDKTRTAADGHLAEVTGTVSTSSSGSDTVITVTILLDNDVATPGGSTWQLYLEIDSYETQFPPQPPNYGGGAGVVAN